MTIKKCKSHRFYSLQQNKLVVARFRQYRIQYPNDYLHNSDKHSSTPPRPNPLHTTYTHALTLLDTDTAPTLQKGILRIPIINSIHTTIGST